MQYYKSSLHNHFYLTIWKKEARSPFLFHRRYKLWVWNVITVSKRCHLNFWVKKSVEMIYINDNSTDDGTRVTYWGIWMLIA